MDKVFQATLGSRLKSLRLAAGVSLCDLAQASNLDVSHYVAVEDHGEGLTFGHLCDIAHSLGATVDQVTDGLTN